MASQIPVAHLSDAENATNIALVLLIIIIYIVLYMIQKYKIMFKVSTTIWLMLLQTLRCCK